MAGLSAYLIWGMAPIYFKWVGFAAPLEVLCHRIVWSTLFLTWAITRKRKWGAVKRALTGRAFFVSLLTGALIAVNWLIYIMAVAHNHLVESSLGYYINPLLTVLLGILFLRERLTRVQWLAIAVAASGVVWLAVSYRAPLWISLALAFSFGFYGLIRKLGGQDPFAGLFAETVLLAPAALTYLVVLAVKGSGTFGHFGSFEGLTQGFALALAGPITAIPLVLFSDAANRLKLSTLGFLQYISPTLQLSLGVLAFGEHFSRAHAIAFALIWSALALYSAQAAWRQRKAAVG